MLNRLLVSLSLLPFMAVPVMANEGQEGLPQFEPTWYASQAFWLMVHFALLYVLTAKLLLPRIADALEKRAQRIAEDLQEAKLVQEQAAEIRSDYEKAIDVARHEGQKVIEASVTAAKQAREEAEKKLLATLAARSQEAHKRLKEAAGSMHRHLREVAMDVSTEIIGKMGVVVEKSVVEAAVVRAIDNEMKEVA